MAWVELVSYPSTRLSHTKRLYRVNKSAFFIAYFFLPSNGRGEGAQIGQKIINLPGGQMNDPLSRKYFSLPSLQQLLRLRLGPLKVFLS